MKKTYNINLNGQVFCIDDDACLKLQSYIDTLESHYLKEEDGRESWPISKAGSPNY